MGHLEKVFIKLAIVIRKFSQYLHRPDKKTLMDHIWPPAHRQQLY
jgi:hypothetical protein